MGERLEDAERLSPEGNLSRPRRLGRWLGKVAGRGESRDEGDNLTPDDPITPSAEREAAAQSAPKNGNGSGRHTVTPELLTQVRQAISAQLRHDSVVDPDADPPLEVGPQRALDHRLWGPGILELLRPGTKHTISDDEWWANRQKTIESMVRHSRADQNLS